MKEELDLLELRLEIIETVLKELQLINIELYDKLGVVAQQVRANDS